LLTCNVAAFGKLVEELNPLGSHRTETKWKKIQIVLQKDFPWMDEGLFDDDRLHDLFKEYALKDPVTGKFAMHT